MLFWAVISIFSAVFLTQAITYLISFRNSCFKKKTQLSSESSRLEAKELKVKREVESLERVLAERFLFYDLTCRIAPLLDKNDLFAKFIQEIHYLGPIEEAKISGYGSFEQYRKFELGRGIKEALYIKTSSNEVIEYLPYFVKILGLCLERIRLYEKLQQLSIYDPLTKIHNRRYSMERFNEEFRRAKRFNHNLSYLMIDVDHFKEINDNHGHLVGDAVLREVARLIKVNIRKIDLAARYGGEEFSVVLPETNRAGAIMLAERINRQVCRQPIAAFDEKISASVSIGLAAYPENSIHPDVLLETADKALYKAK
ncbi:MAG: GGDEF domain-containing protein, partial [Candidatus Omnitrophica bacterium]|nr:GGDEF domain-containing protein [Candidatus Omnitrophota bacterium]